MMHFDEWWNSAAADSFRAKHEDLDGEVFRTVWDAAQLGQAAIKQAAVPQVDTCETCQGNGEVVTDWNRYKDPYPGDKGDEAVSMCQECNGTGEVNAAHPAEGVPAQAVQPSDALIEAVDAWFAENTGLGGCSDKDVSELAEIFATHPTQPAAQGLDAKDAARWRHTLEHRLCLSSKHHRSDIEVCASIDIALAAQAKQGGVA